MTVGIISMQRVKNYGSFLQAYALKGIVESFGNEVTFIDYRPEKPVVEYDKSKRMLFAFRSIPAVEWLNDSVKYYLLGKKTFGYAYPLFYLKKLGISYKNNYNEKVDTVIIGSDEVFNCLQAGFNVGFSPMLFGQNVNAGKIISYAASFGYTDLQGIEKYGLNNKLSDYFKKFDSISVRDENSKRIIEELTGDTPSINLDPVLVYDFPVPDIEIQYDNYAILYTYKSRKYSEDEKNEILKFCLHNNLELISFGSYQDWIPNKLVVDPLTLLAYIKKANYIITDTFHGTVLSIKYNKKFATLVREDNKQKLHDLLLRLNKTDRQINDFKELNYNFDKSIDYDETNEIIRKEKERTYTYLKENI